MVYTRPYATNLTIFGQREKEEGETFKVSSMYRCQCTPCVCLVLPRRSYGKE